MPTYTFTKRSGDGAEFTETMTIAEMEQWLKDHPTWRLVLGAPMIVSGVAGRGSKPDDGFRSLLKKIKKDHPRSTINTY